ncbi:autophagy protein Apg6-domain-containing protein [Syncephalis fuscata]|nr:autophagy protein Apg6-domain-containing protein [Syncephalis fuscata]
MAHILDANDIACQRCGQLLDVHESLLDLNASAFDFLQEREAYSRIGVGASATATTTTTTSINSSSSHGQCNYTVESGEQHPLSRHDHSTQNVHINTSHGSEAAALIATEGGGNGSHRLVNMANHNRWLDLPVNAVPQMGRRVVHAPPMLAPSESFVMLTESQFGEPFGLQGSTLMNKAPQIGGTSVQQPTTGRIHPTKPGTDHGQSVNSSANQQNAVKTGHSNGADSSESGSFSHRLKVIDMLTELTNQRAGNNEDSSIDQAIGRLEHPLCQRCTDLTLDIMSRQLAELTSERDRYAEFLARLDKDLPDAAATADLEKELEALKNEEQAYLDSIQEMENQLTVTRDAFQILEKETQELDVLERSRWEEYNEYETKLCQLDAERDSLELALQQASDWMERLQKTNVFNDAFHISHDGPFGTINGFRLGRLSSQPIEWTEINAAWGLTVLLLQTICNKLNFQLKKYKLVPLGSFSRIDMIEDEKTQYELYGSGEFHLGRLLQNRRFDQGEYAEKQDNSLKLPYRIDNDRIGDSCIRLRFSHEDTWTRALKYALTNTKWLLAFSCSSAQRQRAN